MDCGIYAIKNLVDNKLYIGSSKELKARRSKHFRLLKNGTHKNSHLQRAYNKYGYDNFIFIILAYLEEYELLEMEKRCIDLYQVCNREFGYNICPDPVDATKSEETKKKMSKPKTPEHIRKIVAPRLGRPLTEQHKENIRKSKLGKPMSLDARLKMSLAQQKRHSKV